MYNGFVYNEIFSMPVEFFDSCWTNEFYTINSTDPQGMQAYHRISTDCVYDFGIDPRWA